MRAIIFSLAITLSQVSLAAVTVEEFRSLATEFVSFINPRIQQIQPDQQVAFELIEDHRFLATAEKPIKFSTGLINHPRVTADVVALTMCHEVGHNVAIARHFTPADSVYDNVHLEQDYFAAYDCFTPFILRSSSARQRLSAQQLSVIPADLRTRCSVEHAHPQVCLRAIHASYTLLLAVFEAQTSRFRKNGPPAFARDWLGPTDELQSRLINFVNGIFKDKPFNMGSGEAEELGLEFRL
jgi:hypothetical protein